MPPRSVGLYVHIPFCERVCPYCDFAVVAARPLRPRDEERYVAALERELVLRAAEFATASTAGGPGPLATVYFGGGTPSLLHPESVERIAAAARRAFPGSAGAAAGDLEVTLETNPDTVDRERLPGFRRAGVSRLSIGVQSFDDEVLRRLGRAHKADEARATLEAARAAGFDNVSLDLIFGAPGSSPRQLERDLEEVVRFGPEHVSTYELTIEDATPFGLAARRGQLAAVGDEEAVACLQRIDEALSAVGVRRYEISNHAHPGRESRHNRRYWRREPVLGIGMGAWSLLPARSDAPFGERRSNERSLGAYLERIEEGGDPAAQHDVLSAGAARGEAIFLGLRALDGLCAADFEAEFGHAPRHYFAREIEALVAEGLLDESEAGNVRLTERGLLLADEAAARFV